MTEYPKMLYRDGSEMEWEGRSLDTLTVNDPESEEAALEDGWEPVAPVTGGAPEPTLLDGKAADIEAALPGLTDDELLQLEADEEAGKTRKGVLAAIRAEIEKRTGA